MHTLQAINDIGYWDVFWDRKADWLLMVRLGKAGKRIVHVPKVITEYWWTGSNIGQENPLGGTFPHVTPNFREHLKDIATTVRKGGG